MLAVKCGVFLVLCLMVMVPRVGLRSAAGASPASTTRAGHPSPEAGESAWIALTGRADRARKQGALAEAERSYREALGIAEKLPAGRDLVFDSLHDLAEVCEQQSKLAEATSLYNRLLKLTEARFGRGSQRLDPIYDRLAVLHRKEGHPDLAASCLTAALALRERVLQPTDPKILSTLMDLETVYFAQNRLDRVEHIDRRILAIRRQQGEPTYISQALSALGGTLRRQSRHREASEAFEEQLRVMRRAGYSSTSEYFAAMEYLASSTQLQGKLTEAESIFREGLRLRRKLNGPRSPETIQFIAPLCLCLIDQGRLPEAEELWKQRLAIEKATPGMDPAIIQRSTQRLEELHRKVGSLEQTRKREAAPPR